MELPDKVKNEMTTFRQDIDNNPVIPGITNGKWMVFEWKDEKGDVWSSPILPDFKNRNAVCWEKEEAFAMTRFYNDILNEKARQLKE